MSEKQFSAETRCGHCGNVAPMEITASHSQVRDYDDPASGMSWSAGPLHNLLVCPACDGVSLERYYCHDGVDPSDVKVEIVYPRGTELPVGLPQTIQKEYEAALRVRGASANAYSVLLGRLLELVCTDRGTTKGNLTTRLKFLCDKGEIPSAIVDMAATLYDLRGVGGHAWAGELTIEDVPILDSLCRAVLEYVYSGPYLVKEAADRLQQLREIRSRNKGAS